MENQLLKVFVELLNSTDNQTLTVVLEATFNVLKRGDQDFKDDNPYLSLLE